MAPEGGKLAAHSRVRSRAGESWSFRRIDSHLRDLSLTFAVAGERGLPLAGTRAREASRLSKLVSSA